MIYLPVSPYVPGPDGPPVCARCGGAGLTGDRVALDNPDGPAVLADVFCPDCQGCGRAEHDSCRPLSVGCHPLEHADFDRGELDDGEVEDLLAQQVCPSCWGRRWWSCQSFAPDVDEVVYLRVPCGCAESLVIEVAS